MYYVIQADTYVSDYQPPRGTLLGHWDGSSGIIAAGIVEFNKDQVAPAVVLSVHDTLMTAQLELALNRGDI